MFVGDGGSGSSGRLVGSGLARHGQQMTVYVGLSPALTASGNKGTRPLEATYLYTVATTGPNTAQATARGNPRVTAATCNLFVRGADEDSGWAKEAWTCVNARGPRPA